MNASSKNTFDLPKNEVHLWHCRFDAHRDYLKVFESILSNEEKDKSEKFKFKIHGERSIISRGVLRTLLGKYLKQILKICNSAIPNSVSLF